MTDDVWVPAGGDNKLLNRRRFSFLPQVATSKVPSLISIERELANRKTTAEEYFRSKERGQFTQKATRRHTSADKMTTVTEQSFAELMLLNAEGVGGLTKGVAMLEDLLQATEGEELLLCISYSIEGSVNPLYEKYRQFCVWNKFLYSNFRLCGYGIKKKRLKQAEDYHGDYLQIPLRISSNPSGPFLLRNNPCPVQALSTNYNPSVYVSYYCEESAIVSNNKSLRLCQIHLKDILLCKLQLRYLQLNGPLKSTTRNFTEVFTGTTEKKARENNYSLLQQLLREVRGDCTLTLRIINDFNKVLQRAVLKEEKQKQRRQAAKAAPLSNRKIPAIVSPNLKQFGETVRGSFTPSVVSPNLKQSQPSTKQPPFLEELEDFLVGAQDSELARDGSAYSCLKKIDKSIGAVLEGIPKDWTCLLKTGLDLNDFVVKIKNECPASWISVLNSRAPRSSVDNEQKEVKMLLHLAGLLRERHSEFLPNLALVFGFASMARGYAHGSQEFAEAMAMKSSKRALRRYMEENAVTFKESPKRLYQKFRCLTFALDNYQRGQRLRVQRNMQSNSFSIGTNGFVLRERVAKWPPGTILQELDDNFNCKDKWTIVSLVESNEDGYSRTFQTIALDQDENELKQEGTVVLPNLNYIVDHCPSLDNQPELTYVDQKVPAPLGWEKLTSHYRKEVHVAYMMQMLSRFITSNVMEHADATQNKRTLPPLETQTTHKTTAPLILLDMISPIRATLVGMRNSIYDEGLNWKAEAQDGTSQFQFLELMPFDETTKEGLEACIKRILETIGSITTDKNGVSQTTALTDIRRLFAYGDQLTMKHLETLKEQVLKKTIEADKPEHWTAFLEALDTIHVILGDLHVEMHVLAAIFKFAYGGFLQPIQHVLGWLRIQRNTVPRHQQSTQLFLLVLTQMKRYVIQKWAKSLKSDSMMTLAHVIIPSRKRSMEPSQQGPQKQPRLDNPQADKVGVDVDNSPGDSPLGAVPLSDLDKQDATTIVLSLVESLQNFLDEKRKSKDAVVRFFMQIMDLGEQFEEYRRGTHDGDSIICELLRIELLPVFQVMGKTNYVDLFATVMEVLYRDMGRHDLEEQRLNDRIRLTLGKGQIPLDHLCELMNLWTKRQSNSSMDTAIRRSLYLALMQICHKFAKEFLQRPVPNVKESAKSNITLNQKIVSWLIDDCGRMLEELDRKEIPNRFLWQHAKAARARFEKQAKERRTTKRKEVPYPETETDTSMDDEVDDDKGDPCKWPLHKLANKNIVVEGKIGLKGLRKKRATRGSNMKRLFRYVREADALRKKLETESEVENTPIASLPASSPTTVIDALRIFLPEGVYPHLMQVSATQKLTERAATLALAAPTGTGKSLIIAGTALLRGGITVVFEPLLAVGADQTREMKRAISQTEETINLKNRMTRYWLVHLLSNAE
jgi:hypothetical protein